MLLLDEPLSALDAKIRVSLREEIRAIQRELGITTIYRHPRPGRGAVDVRPHRGDERRRVEQVGTPFEIYNCPATAFVASFVGTLNLLDVTVDDPKTGMLRFDKHRILCARGLDGTVAGQARTIALRPEAMTVGATATPDETNAITAIVEDVKFLGPVIRVSARVQDKKIQVDQFNTSNMKPPQEGEPLTLRFAAEDVLVRRRIRAEAPGGPALTPSRPPRCATDAPRGRVAPWCIAAAPCRAASAGTWCRGGSGRR